MPGHAPAVTAQDDVHPVTPEPRTLVEPVLRPARLLQHPEHLEDVALRGATTRGELEQDRFRDAQRSEAMELGGHP